MLVLSRKESQNIMIGDDIELTVVSVQGGRVRLGISAPKNVRIRRSELERSYPLRSASARPPEALIEIGENQFAQL